MKTQINEAKRMQQLAGILKENATLHVVHELNKIINKLKASHKISDKTAEKILDYAAKHGEDLYYDIGNNPDLMFKAAVKAINKKIKT